MSLICCRKCSEPRCDGCNIYILERALYAGELRGYMSDGYTIDRRLFLPRGTAKSLYTEPKYDPDEFFSAERKNKRKE